MYRNHLVALAGHVLIDRLEVGHRRLGSGGGGASGLEAAIEVIGLDIHPVLERLAVHHHVARQYRDLMLLDQFRGQVC